MKKLLFQIGDVSQLAYAFQPVVQHQMVLSNTPDTTDPMQVPQIPIEPIDIVPIRDYDNTYESALYFTRPEVADFVENTLENLPIGVEREQFLEKWKEKTNDFTTGKLTEQDIIDSIGRENFKTKDLNLINSNIDNKSKTLTKKEIKDSRSINKNKSNTSYIKSSNRDLVNSKKKQQDLITSNEWEKAKKSFFYKKEKLKNYIEYLHSIDTKNQVFNDISIALTAVAWGLAAAYTAAAFWTFGATIPLAISATVQASLSTWFLKSSIDEQNEIKKNLIDIEKFYNSYEVQFMSDFFNKKYSEINEIFKDNTDDLKKWKNFLSEKLITYTFDQIIEEFNTKWIHKTINWMEKNSFKTPLNSWKELLKYPEERCLGPKVTGLVKFYRAMKNIDKTIADFVASSTEKRIIIVSTAIANPIGEFLNFLDSMLSYLNLVTTFVIDYIHK
ncbi:hypothetical protein [Mycoplasma sp. 1654_15]|uniref:hypothetical protein n=1 Tax=Mycoplasma sp. 1654_15 TaxID=2725994 RepID=UPI001448C25A|nr:hypothetical protein [Mycoplasma sp. 1654_15]QJB71419.1 hypothetical protein HF996_03015 [Mycoplasma sp. 1654_15]